MVADEHEAGTAVRRRPKDRKTQIVKAAARAFSERGYHRVGVDDIAADVGVSGPALYRHFTNKYALFVAAAEYTARSLATAAQTADDSSRPPAERLGAVVDSLIETSIDMRWEGALYRWERRYLEPDDRKRLRGIYDTMNTAVAEPLATFRPGLVAADIEMLAAAVLSTIGSISAHRVSLSAARLRALLNELCWSVLSIRLPSAPVGRAAHGPAKSLQSSSKRERLLVEAIRVFGRRGFSESSIEEIGSAANMKASSVYRYYSSKAELLAATFHRAGDRFRLGIADALAQSNDPFDAAGRIAEHYVALAFATPELLNIYFAEFANLPQRNQADLRMLQRQNINEWSHLVEQVRPGRTEALFRVQAALALGVDIGRLVHFDHRSEQQARVHTLMTTVLFGQANVSDDLC